MLLTATALLSLATYVRACWRSDEFTLAITSSYRTRELYSVFSDRGRVGASFTKHLLHPGYTYIDPKQPPKSSVAITHVGTQPRSETTVLGAFGTILETTSSEVPAGTGRTTTLSLPTPGLFVGSLSLLTIMRIREHRRRSWALIGKCKRCGYDLRATPGCCPECGPIESSNASSANSPKRYNPMAGATEFLTERQRAKSKD